MTRYESGRLVKLTLDLVRGVAVTSAYIRKKHGVSRATAVRDLLMLECNAPVSVELRPYPGTAIPQKVLTLQLVHK